MKDFRHIFGIFVLCVFALRALVPTGFMLESAGGKKATLLGLEVVICTGHLTKSVTDDAFNSGKPKPAKHQTNSDMCPYSGLSHVADAAEASKSLETTVRYAEVVYTLTAQVFAATPLPGPLSARGPPSNVI